MASIWISLTSRIGSLLCQPQRLAKTALGGVFFKIVDVIGTSALRFRGKDAKILICIEHRNDIHVVSRFLSSRHYGKFFVFNLCDTSVSSDGEIGNYHARMFFNQVQRIPFEDHGPPLLNELIHFCREATKWLRGDLENIIAVHCKGGKGRTGIMIAALLLWGGHRKCAMDAMELFTFRRTQNYNPDQGIDDSGRDSSSSDLKDLKGKGILRRGKSQPNRGVDGPSQQRYVFYIEAMMYTGINPFQSDGLFLKALSLPSGNAQHKDWYVSYTVRCQRTLVLDSFSKGQTTALSKKNEASQMFLPCGVLLDGDTRIDFWR